MAFSKDLLRRILDRYCNCGGRGPSDPEACDACRIWHDYTAPPPSRTFPWPPVVTFVGGEYQQGRDPGPSWQKEIEHDAVCYQGPDGSQLLDEDDI